VFAKPVFFLLSFLSFLLLFYWLFWETIKLPFGSKRSVLSLLFYRYFPSLLKQNKLTKPTEQIETFSTENNSIGSSKFILSLTHLSSGHRGSSLASNSPLAQRELSVSMVTIAKGLLSWYLRFLCVSLKAFSLIWTRRLDNWATAPEPCLYL